VTAEARFGSLLALPGFGPSGLVSLGAARVLLVGAGALGASALSALVRAGVGLVAVDDPAEVSPADAVHGLYPPAASGELRITVARQELRAARPGARVEPFSSALRPSAVVVCAETTAAAQRAAEAARVARLPHVVALGSAGGGHVVTVPFNGACYACAAPPAGVGPCAPSTSMALGSLAAAEALLMLVGYAREPRGRLIVLADGKVTARATARRPGCACAAPR
jgi:hypothetical protein